MMQSSTRTSTNQNPPSAEQLQQEIQQSINAARDAAREAAQNAAQAQGRNGRQIVIGPIPPTPPSPRGFYVGDQGFRNDIIPPQVVDIAMGFFIMCAVIVIGWPLARAFGRRIERRAAEPASLNPQMAEQLQRIEQAVDAMSVEIERISESQRYLAKLQSPSAALPADRR